MVSQSGSYRSFCIKTNVSVIAAENKIYIFFLSFTVFIFSVFICSVTCQYFYFKAWKGVKKLAAFSIQKSTRECLCLIRIWLRSLRLDSHVTKNIHILTQYTKSKSFTKWFDWWPTLYTIHILEFRDELQYHCKPTSNQKWSPYRC